MEELFTIESMELWNLQTNCYIVVDNHSQKAVVIDPADEGDRIFRTVQERGWILEKILPQRTRRMRSRGQILITKSEILNKFKLPKYKTCQPKGKIQSDPEAAMRHNLLRRDGVKKMKIVPLRSFDCAQDKLHSG